MKKPRAKPTRPKHKQTDFFDLGTGELPIADNLEMTLVAVDVDSSVDTQVLVDSKCGLVDLIVLDGEQLHAAPDGIEWGRVTPPPKRLKQGTSDSTINITPQVGFDVAALPALDLAPAEPELPPTTATATTESTADRIQLKLQSKSGESAIYVSMADTVGDILRRYQQKYPAHATLSLDGEMLDSSTSVEDMDLDDGDVLQVNN